MPGDAAIDIVAAQRCDVAEILRLIRGLAAYEKLLDEAIATEADIRDSLFGARPYAEALIARAGGRAVGFALFFHNYSTFTGRPGLYVEDVFVEPEWRGKGIGGRLFARMAKIAVERRCARMEWAVLDWNTPSIEFYRGLGARALDEWTVQRLTGEMLSQLAAKDR